MNIYLVYATEYDSYESFGNEEYISNYGYVEGSEDDVIKVIEWLTNNRERYGYKNQYPKFGYKKLDKLDLTKMK
jgi:hypothetical protein